MRKQTKAIKLTGMQLKYIAMFCMLLDHIGSGILYPVIAAGNDDPLLSVGYYTMRVVGRLAFPIYCFLVAEGVKHTRHLKKYVLSLWAFALISEIPFDMELFGQVFCIECQNVFFTIALAITGYALIDKTHEKWKKVLILAISLLVSILIRSDYSWIGIALLYAFFYSSLQIRIFALTEFMICSIFRLFGISTYSCLIAGVVITWIVILTEISYGGERGEVYGSKYLYYSFYPAHLLIIGLIRALLIN